MKADSDIEMHIEENNEETKTELYSTNTNKASINKNEEKKNVDLNTSDEI